MFNNPHFVFTSNINRYYFSSYAIYHQLFIFGVFVSVSVGIGIGVFSNRKSHWHLTFNSHKVHSAFGTCAQFSLRSQFVYFDVMTSNLNRIHETQICTRSFTLEYFIIRICFFLHKLFFHSFRGRIFFFVPWFVSPWIVYEIWTSVNNCYLY